MLNDGDRRRTRVWRKGCPPHIENSYVRSIAYRLTPAATHIPTPTQTTDLSGQPRTAPHFSFREVGPNSGLRASSRRLSLSCDALACRRGGWLPSRWRGTCRRRPVANGMRRPCCARSIVCRQADAPRDGHAKTLRPWREGTTRWGPKHRFCWRWPRPHAGLDRAASRSMNAP